MREANSTDGVRDNTTNRVLVVDGGDGAWEGALTLSLSAACIAGLLGVLVPNPIFGKNFQPFFDSVGYTCTLRPRLI